MLGFVWEGGGGAGLVAGPSSSPTPVPTHCADPSSPRPTPPQVLNGTLFAASTGRIDDRWRSFMQFQIARARQVFKDAEDGVNMLAPEARWPVWCVPPRRCLLPAVLLLHARLRLLCVFPAAAPLPPAAAPLSPACPSPVLHTAPSPPPSP